MFVVHVQIQHVDIVSSVFRASESEEILTCGMASHAVRYLPSIFDKIIGISKPMSKHQIKYT